MRLALHSLRQRTRVRLTTWLPLTGAVVVCMTSGGARTSVWVHARVRQDGRDSTYAHYTTRSCVQAVERTTATFWRGGPDTSRDALLQDTMLTVSADVARQCVARFGVATTVPRDLLPLAELYLAAGDDSAAAEAVARRLATRAPVPGGGGQARTLAQVVSVYLNARPRRIERARQYIGVLDTLHAQDAPVWRLAVHAMLLNYAYEIVSDDKLAAAEAEAVVAAGGRLMAHDRVEFGWALVRAYDVLAQRAADRESLQRDDDGGSGRSATAARALLHRARKDIGMIPDVAEQLDALDSATSLYGMVAPPLSGVWFGSATDLGRPTPGKVSLLIFTPSREIAPGLRRLNDEFGDTLEITLVGQTSGYIEGRGLVPANTEMASLWHYYHTTLGAPGALVLNETRFVTLPDGRRVAQPAENQRIYKTPFHVGAVLVDRHGIIRMVQTRWNERRLAGAVRRLL